MTEILDSALALWQVALSGAALVFLRIGAIMALLPAFGERSVPVRIRLVLSVLFTVVTAPAILPLIPRTGTSADLFRLAATEVVAGLALGIVLRLMVLVLQIAGTIAANATSLSQLLGGASVDPQPAMSHILVVGGLALLAMAGLHVEVARAVIASYELFPPGRPIPSEGLAEWGSGRVAEAFALSFTLAAPFLIVSTLYNLALGAINRAMPQLMVAFVGAPAITFGGLVLMAISAPFLLDLWRGAFAEVLTGFGG